MLFVLVGVLLAGWCGAQVVDVSESDCFLNITVDGAPVASSFDLSRLQRAGQLPIEGWAFPFQFSYHPCKSTVAPSESACSDSAPVSRAYGWGWVNATSTCLNYGSDSPESALDWMSNPPTLVQRVEGSSVGCSASSRELEVHWTCDPTGDVTEAPECKLQLGGEAPDVCLGRIRCTSALACPLECGRTGGQVCGGTGSGDVCNTDLDSLESACVSTSTSGLCRPSWVLASGAGDDLESGSVDGVVDAVSGWEVWPNSSNWAFVRAGFGLEDGVLRFAVNVSTIDMMIGVAPSDAAAEACESTDSDAIVFRASNGASWLEGVAGGANSDWSVAEGDLVLVEADVDEGTVVVSVVLEGGLSVSDLSSIDFEGIVISSQFTLTSALPPLSSSTSYHPAVCFPEGGASSEAGVLMGSVSSISRCSPLPNSAPSPSPSPSPAASVSPLPSPTPGAQYGNYCWADISTDLTTYFRPEDTYPSRACVAAAHEAGDSGSCSAQVGYGIQRGSMRYAARCLTSTGCGIGYSEKPSQSFGRACTQGDAKGTFVLDANGVVYERSDVLHSGVVNGPRDFDLGDVVVVEINAWAGTIYMWIVEDSTGSIATDLTDGLLSISDLDLNETLSTIVTDSLEPNTIYYPTVCSTTTLNKVQILALQREQPECQPWPSITPTPTATASPSPSVSPTANPTTTPTPTTTPSPSSTPSPSLSATPSPGHLNTNTNDDEEEGGSKKLTLNDYIIIGGSSLGALICICCTPLLVSRCTKKSNVDRSKKKLMAADPEEDALVGGGIVESALTDEIGISNPMRDAEEEKRRAEAEAKAKKEAERKKKMERVRKFRKARTGGAEV